VVVRPKVVGDPVGPTGFEWDEEKGAGRFELKWMKGGLLWDSLPEVVLQDFAEECLELVLMVSLLVFVFVLREREIECTNVLVFGQDDNFLDDVDDDKVRNLVKCVFHGVAG
jgi:hypothetical protein